MNQREGGNKLKIKGQIVVVFHGHAAYMRLNAEAYHAYRRVMADK